MFHPWGKAKGDKGHEKWLAPRISLRARGWGGQTREKTVLKNQAEPSSVLGDAFLQAIRQAVREEVRQAVGNVTGNHDPEKPYLTIKEVAEVSRLAPSTIRLAIRKRELRSLKVGSRVIIKREDLEQFLEANPVCAVPE